MVCSDLFRHALLRLKLIQVKYAWGTDLLDSGGMAAEMAARFLVLIFNDK